MVVARRQDEIAVGYKVPPFVRIAGFHNWNRYAAVNSEFVDHHMDDEAGRAGGYPGAFGMGNLTYAWLHCMFREWLSPLGRVVRMACQFRGAVLKGDTVTCSGVVTRVYEDGGRRMADLDVWAENQRGERIVPGTATVTFQS